MKTSKNASKQLKNLTKKAKQPGSSSQKNKKNTLARKVERKSNKESSPLYLWGRHAIESYLGQPHEDFNSSQHSLHIIVDKQGKAPSQLRNIVELAKSLEIRIHTHKSEEDGWPLFGEDHIVHQRVCLQVPAIPLTPLHHIETLVAEHKQACGCLGIVLDQIQDAHNFGAILRTAAFLGAKFVIFGKDRQAPLSAHVLKASAGGAFVLKLCEVVNIGRALESLKEHGAWILGTTLTEAEAQSLEKIPIDRPYVLVLGNEHKGLRAEITKKCDMLTYIPRLTESSTIDSLNVSVAAGIFLYYLQAQSLKS